MSRKLGELYVGVGLDERSANAAADRIKSTLRSVDQTKVQPKITLPEKPAEDVEALQKRLTALGKQKVALNVNSTLARSEVATLTRQLSVLQRTRTEVPVELQPGIDKQIADVTRELEGLRRRETKIPMTIERVDDKIAAIRAQLEGLGDRPVEVEVEVKPDIDSRLARSAGEKVGGDFNRGFFSRVRDLAVAQLAVNSLGKGFPDLTLGVDGAAKKATFLAAGLTSVAAAGGPVLALAGGLAAGFAAAGAGVGAFGALLGPQISAVGDALTATKTAQDAYNAAIAAGDEKGAAKALEAREAALANLTPAQRDATVATLELKDAFREQSNAFSTPALAAYTQGVKTVQGLLPLLVDLATPASEALIEVFEGANKAAQGPGLRDFVGYVAGFVKPAILDLADIAGNLGTAFANAFKLMLPGATLALGVLDDLTEQLRTASSSTGFVEFLNDADGLLVPLGEAISSVVGAVGSLIKAALPLGGPVLSMLKTVGDVLQDLFQSSNFEGFVSNIGGILKALEPLLRTLGDVAGRVFEVLSGQLLDLMPVLIPAVQAFAEVFADVLVGLSPLLPALVELGAVLLNALLPAVYPLITAFRTAMIPLVKALATAIEASTPAFEEIVEAVASLLPPIADLLAGLAPLVPILIRALVPAAQAVVDVMLALMPSIMDLVPPVVDLADALGGALARVLPVIAEALIEVVEAIAPMIPQLVEALLPAVVAMVDAFVAFLPVIIGLIPPLVRLAVPVLGALVKIIEILSPLFEVWFGFVEALYTPLQRLGDIIDDVLNGRMSEAQESMALMGDELMAAGREWLPKIWAAMEEVGKALWEWIGPMIPPALEKLREFATAVAEWLVDVALPWLGEQALKLGAALWEWVEPQIPKIIEALLGFVGDIVSWLMTDGVQMLIDGLAGLGGALIKGVGAGISAGFTAIKGIFTGNQADIEAGQKTHFGNLQADAATGMGDIQSKSIEPGWTGIGSAFSTSQTEVEKAYGTHWGNLKTEASTEMPKINRDTLEPGFQGQERTFSQSQTDIEAGYGDHWTRMKEEAAREMPKINSQTLVPGFNTQKATQDQKERDMRNSWDDFWEEQKKTASSTMQDIITNTRTKGDTLVKAVKSFVDRAGDEMDKIKSRFKIPVDYVMSRALSRIRSAYNAVARTVSMKTIPAFAGGGQVGPKPGGPSGSNQAVPSPARTFPRSSPGVARCSPSWRAVAACAALAPAPPTRSSASTGRRGSRRRGSPIGNTSSTRRAPTPTSRSSRRLTRPTARSRGCRASSRAGTSRISPAGRWVAAS